MWTDNAALAPEGYDEYVLCTKVYHCTPRQLAEQDADTVARDLAFWNAEMQNDKAVRKMQAAQSKGSK